MKIIKKTRFWQLFFIGSIVSFLYGAVTAFEEPGALCNMQILLGADPSVHARKMGTDILTIIPCGVVSDEPDTDQNNFLHGLEVSREKYVVKDGFKYHIICGLSDALSSNYDLPIIIYPMGFSSSFLNPLSIGVYCFAVPQFYDYLNFNFGQKTDQDSLDAIIKKVTEKKSQSLIGLCTLCAGSAAALRYLSNKQYSSRDKISFAILEGPSTSLYEVANHTVAYRFTGWLKYLAPLSQWVNIRLFRFLFPQAKVESQESDYVIDSIKKYFPKDIYLLIGSLVHDPTTSHERALVLTQLLKEKVGHKRCCLYVSDDKTVEHGALMKDVGFREKIFQILSNVKEKASNF